MVSCTYLAEVIEQVLTGNLTKSSGIDALTLNLRNRNNPKLDSHYIRHILARL